MLNKLAPLLVTTSMLVLFSGSPKYVSMESHFQVPIYKTSQNSTEDGKNLYVKYCLSCHQSDGSGVPNMFPPIRNSDWVNGDKNKIISVLLNGLDGDIDVNEEPFSQVMPKQDSLTDLQIAQLLTYIRQNFGNNADAVQPADVSNLRLKK